MKPRLLILPALLLSFAASAADGPTILARLASKMASLSPYRVMFTVSAEDMGESKGETVVDGDRYDIRIDGQRQFSDGENLYRINALDKEVTIDKQNAASRNLFDNPARAFDFAAESFEVGETTSADGNNIVQLVPAEGVLNGVSKVIVSVDRKTLLPNQLRYVFEGTQIVVKITSVEKYSLPSGLFVYNPDDYAGYEIIDFR